MSTCYRISQYKILTRILYRQNTDIHTKSNKKTEVSVLNLKTIFGLKKRRKEEYKFKKRRI